MRSVVYAILALLALAPRGVHADEPGGEKLLKSCGAAVRKMDGSGAESLVEATYCLGLMDGTITTSFYYMQLLDGPLIYCLPASGISSGQAARIVVKYLKENPEKLHESMTQLTILALSNAYPCGPAK